MKPSFDRRSMNNSNYPLKVSKNKLPSFTRKDKLWNRKINEENIENNLVFCIDARETFANQIPRSVFRNPSNKNKICLIYISVKL